MAALPTSARSVLSSLLRAPSASFRRALASAPAAPAKAAPYPPLVYNTGILASSVKALFPSAASPLPPDYRPDPALLAPQIPTLVSTLPNGLRVASQQLPTPGAATLGIWIDAGTRFENHAHLNGAAHFLEHLIFKGTNKRTQRALEMEVEDLGAHLNAYTSREQTAYYARALTKDLPQMTELLANILNKSTLDDAAIDRERGVILREMQEVETMPEEVLFDYLHGTAYQGTPLASTILGPSDAIKSMTRDHLLSYVSEHYKPHRMVLAAAGDVDHDALVGLAKTHFGSILASNGEKAALDYILESPAHFLGSDVRVRNDDAPLAHFAIAFESCGWAHPDAVAFMVFQSLIGSYNAQTSRDVASAFSSPLARVIANEVDNCQSFMAFNTTYTDTGLFGVYCVAEAPDLDDVAHAVMIELVRPCFKINEAELERAKRAVKISMLAQLDGSTNVAEEIGRQILVYGRRIPTVEMFARIDAVDADALKRIANKYIYDRDVAIAAMGPIHSLPDYNWIRRRTYWNSY